jgi:hypothetical protein
MMTDDVRDRAVLPTPNLSAKLAKPSEMLAYRVLDGQGVIVNLESGTLHVLNSVGTRIWEAFDGGTTLKEVIQQLSREYSVPYAQLETDAIEFVRELLQNELLLNLA